MTPDDWRSETQSRLKSSNIYKTLVDKCKDDPAGAKVMALVDDAVSYSYQRTKTILCHMGEFTLHDGDHLFRVLSLMERLLDEQNLKNLSIPELMLLILTAFFHDIGMAPDEAEYLTWKKVLENDPQFTSLEEALEYKKFKRFYDSRPEQQDEISHLYQQGKYQQAETTFAYMITDYIRQTHAERARQIIGKDWDNKIVYRDTDLTVEFAQLCFGHNEDPLTLLEMDKNYLCGPGIFACLPLIGVLLRIADILDFDAKRTPAILFSHLNVRHPISIKEWNKHRSVDAWEISPQSIQFNAKCKHPAIEESIHEFCDLIDKELSICNNIITIINTFNKGIGRDLSLKIPFKVIRDKIETKKDIYNKPIYIYRPTKFNLSKRQVIDLLMGTKLYGNPQVALRELLQNSIDACLLRQAQEKQWGNLYLPEITVRYYLEDGDYVLEVIDNGTGMDQYIIDNYYSNIGSSFYKSADFYNLKSESNADFTPTSRFGIGILSCFMVADTLIVDTKKVYGPHRSNDSLNITVEGQDSIFWIRQGKRENPGTTTKLILRERNPWVSMSEEEFINSAEAIVPNPPFKINLQTKSQQSVRDENSFSELSATSIKDNSWRENENIRLLEFEFGDKAAGIIGSASVAILESQNEPAENVVLKSIDINVEGETYKLDKRLWLSENLIKQESNSITVTDEGAISKDRNYTEFARSRSKVSVHGIEVPTSLFPRSYELKQNQVEINWPLPLILIVDVCGNRDLDLNSSRTEVIMSEKWTDFEEELAYLICKGIREMVEVEYWDQLNEILMKTKNSQFLNALQRIQND
jgi:molecular chaperone HtpG